LKKRWWNIHLVRHQGIIENINGPLFLVENIDEPPKSFFFFVFENILYMSSGSGFVNGALFTDRIASRPRRRSQMRFPIALRTDGELCRTTSTTSLADSTNPFPFFYKSNENCLDARSKIWMSPKFTFIFNFYKILISIQVFIFIPILLIIIIIMF